MKKSDCFASHFLIAVYMISFYSVVKMYRLHPGWKRTPSQVLFVSIFGIAGIPGRILATDSEKMKIQNLLQWLLYT